MNRTSYENDQHFSYIDVEAGKRKFLGNVNQFKNMVFMFNNLTLDDYISQITRHLKKEETPEVINLLSILIEAAQYIKNSPFFFKFSDRINEIRRYSMICETFKQMLERFEYKMKSPYEIIKEFEIFLNETFQLKQEIEKFTSKKVSYEELTEIQTSIRNASEMKRLSNSSYSPNSIEIGRIIDDRKMIFGSMEKRKVKQIEDDPSLKRFEDDKCVIY